MLKLTVLPLTVLYCSNEPQRCTSRFPRTSIHQSGASVAASSGHVVCFSHYKSSHPYRVYSYCPAIILSVHVVSHEDLLTQIAVVWSCLPFIGSGQTFLQGTVKGGRRQGRQRKKWEDKSREWTGLEFARSQRAGENRKKWRKQVAKLSVVPQRPRG